MAQMAMTEKGMTEDKTIEGIDDRKTDVPKTDVPKTDARRAGSALLDVRDLRVRFHTDEGDFEAVSGVSFQVDRGEIVGLVGESGCGKSVTALSLTRLIPRPDGEITHGRVIFDGEDLLTLPAREMRRIRGRKIAMIFQEPSAALSPLHRVGRQLVEAIRLHREMDKRAAREMARGWLEKVRIPDAGERMHAYPYQMSGGMQQRVMIAMALMLDPALLIADEPTTALDVTVQAQIFSLIRQMRGRDTAILLITHDMGVVWEMCDRVMVMYAARIVETGKIDDIFARPGHPYTRGLLASIPRISAETDRLAAIPGTVPSPFHFPSGCRFRDRCPHAFDRCAREAPPLHDLGNGHGAACFVASELTHKGIDPNEFNSESGKSGGSGASEMRGVSEMPHKAVASEAPIKSEPQDRQKTEKKPEAAAKTDGGVS